MVYEMERMRQAMPQRQTVCWMRSSWRTWVSASSATWPPSSTKAPLTRRRLASSRSLRGAADYAEGLRTSPGLFLQNLSCANGCVTVLLICGSSSHAVTQLQSHMYDCQLRWFSTSGRARRLLQERSPALHGLPHRWLHQLLARAAAPGQSRDDILRRSAGLPAAIIALFLAEPANQARKVRATTTRSLICGSICCC